MAQFKLKIKKIEESLFVVKAIAVTCEKAFVATSKETLQDACDRAFKWGSTLKEDFNGKPLSELFFGEDTTSDPTSGSDIESTNSVVKPETQISQPDDSLINNVIPEGSAPETPKKKRHRRSKAEIAAEKAAKEAEKSAVSVQNVDTTTDEKATEPEIIDIESGTKNTTAHTTEESSGIEIIPEETVPVEEKSEEIEIPFEHEVFESLFDEGEAEAVSDIDQIVDNTNKIGTNDDVDTSTDNSENPTTSADNDNAEETPSEDVDWGEYVIDHFFGETNIKLKDLAAKKDGIKKIQKLSTHSLSKKQNREAACNYLKQIGEAV